MIHSISELLNNIIYTYFTTSLIDQPEADIKRWYNFSREGSTSLSTEVVVTSVAHIQSPTTSICDIV